MIAAKKIGRFLTALIGIACTALICLEIAPSWARRFPTQLIGPAAHYNNLSFLACRDGDLYCLDQKGQVRWKKTVDSALFAPPVIDRGGTVFTAGGNGRVTALNQKGKTLFSRQITGPLRTAPLLLPGALLLVNDQGVLFALQRSTGEILWKKELGVPVFTSAVLDVMRSRILLVVDDFALLSLDLRGEIQWRVQTEGANHTPVALSETGEVYLASMDHQLYKISSSGEILWKYRTERWLKVSPVIDDRGNVYFGGHDQEFRALSPDGKQLWNFRGRGPFTATAAIDDNGNLYTGDLSGAVYALTSQGALIWSHKFSDFMEAPFSIRSRKQLLYGGDIGGEIFYFSIPAVLAKNGGWPKLLADERNACRAD